MRYADFIDSLDHTSCPAGLEPALQALWHDARGDWDRAHRIVQDAGGRMPARVHAYLHRREGDDWNARYWHRQAGTDFPQGMALEAEWQLLVRQLTAG